MANRRAEEKESRGRELFSGKTSDLRKKERAKRRENKIRTVLPR